LWQRFGLQNKNPHGISTFGAGCLLWAKVEAIKQKFVRQFDIFPNISKTTHRNRKEKSQVTSEKNIE